MTSATTKTPAEWRDFYNRHAERFAHLSARPGAKHLSLDDMERLTGVGHTTLSKIRTGLYGPKMVDIANRLLALDSIDEEEAHERLGVPLARPVVDDPAEPSSTASSVQSDPMGGFEPGDVVKLRSDGPLMTVNGVSPETEMLICMWFAMPQGICMMGGFHPKALELVKARERPQMGKVTKLRSVDAD